jgi:hypothetical protein
MTNLGKYRVPSDNEERRFTISNNGDSMTLVYTHKDSDGNDVWHALYSDNPFDINYKIKVKDTVMSYHAKEYNKTFGNRWVTIGESHFPGDLTSLMGLATIKNTFDSYWEERVETIETNNK